MCCLSHSHSPSRSRFRSALILQGGLRVEEPGEGGQHGNAVEQHRHSEGGGGEHAGGLGGQVTTLSLASPAGHGPEQGMRRTHVRLLCEKGEPWKNSP